MKRRMLSCLMTLVLVLGLLPGAALAENATAVPDGKAVLNGKTYDSLYDAMDAAESGATIYLGAGTYNGNAEANAGTGAHKTLTFVGAGTDATTWNILENGYRGGADGYVDYSFDNRNMSQTAPVTVTFKNLTMVSSIHVTDNTIKDYGGDNYLRGLVGIDNMVLENCVVNGIVSYWGYKTTKFDRVTFNAPGTAASGTASANYSLWTYTGESYTFKDCVFNSANGKTINVYRHGDTGHDIVVDFESCTFNTASHDPKEAPNPVNINDFPLSSTHKYAVSFDGTMAVNGFGPSKLTCSRLFCFGADSKGSSNNTGKTVVSFGDTAVWENGEMVDKKAFHNSGVTADGVSYTNGLTSSNASLYAEGCKDDAFTTAEETQGNRIVTTKTCDYCGYTEVSYAYHWTWATEPAKTATALNRGKESTVTLTLPSAEITESGANGGETTVYAVSADSTVEDKMGSEFDLVPDSFTLTVGGTALPMAKDGDSTYCFGDKDDAAAAAASTTNCRFKVVCDADEDKFTWTINEDVANANEVKLSYRVKLTDPSTAAGPHVVPTNEYARLTPKDSGGNTGAAMEFDKPTVSYTVPGGNRDDDDDYYFAIEKIDAQDSHALNGATFALYQYNSAGKTVNRTTVKTSQNGSARGIALFRVDSISGNGGEWYYAEVAAPEGYVLDTAEHRISAKDFSASRSAAIKNATTVRNYRSATPDMLNGDDHFAYVMGYSDGLVRPYNLITRAETTTIFFRLLKDEVRDGNLRNSNPYTDISDTYWANTAISTMSELGIVQGFSDGTFRPYAPITRAQFAAICARFDTGISSGTQTFSDIDGHWAQRYIERAAELGWIKGFEDGTFRPDTYITRAQAMTMINRVLNRIPEDEDDLLEDMNVWPDNTPDMWCYLAVQEATNSHDFKHKGGNYETWIHMNPDPDWTRYEN